MVYNDTSRRIDATLAIYSWVLAYFVSKRYFASCYRQDALQTNGASCTRPTDKLYKILVQTANQSLTSRHFWIVDFRHATTTFSIEGLPYTIQLVRHLRDANAPWIASKSVGVSVASDTKPSITAHHRERHCTTCKRHLQMTCWHAIDTNLIHRFTFSLWFLELCVVYDCICALLVMTITW